MKKHTQTSITIWSMNILVIAFGFFPYRLSLNRNYRSTENVLLVEHHECTCCSDFQIIKGEILIPDSLKNNFSDHKPWEILIQGENISTFSGKESNFDLLVNNSFVIKGRMVGIDNEHGCKPRPIFEIESWNLKSYYPRFLTFGNLGLLIYLLICTVFIIFSVVRLRKQFTKLR